MTPKKSLGALALAAIVLVALSACVPIHSNPAGRISHSATDDASTSGGSASTKALPLNAGGYLSGNATPNLPAGDKGISVLGQGTLVKDPLGGGTLLFSFRNNTSADVAHVDFTATATAGGKLVATGSSQGVIPGRVKPGEPGLGFIYFADASSIPDGAVTYAFKSTSSPGDATPFNTAPLKIDQLSNNGQSFIGSATNTTGKSVTGPNSVHIYCFSGDSLTGDVEGYTTESDTVAAGGNVTFSVYIGDTACDSYMAGVTGFFA